MRWIRQAVTVRQLALISLLTLAAAFGSSQATWAIEPRLQTVPTRASTGSATAVSSGTPGTGATETPFFGGTPSTGAIATATALALITPTAEPATPTPESTGLTPEAAATDQPPVAGGTLRTVGIAVIVAALVILVGTIAAILWRQRTRPS